VTAVAAAFSWQNAQSSSPEHRDFQKQNHPLCTILPTVLVEHPVVGEADAQGDRCYASLEAFMIVVERLSCLWPRLQGAAAEQTLVQDVAQVLNAREMNKCRDIVFAANTLNLPLPLLLALNGWLPSTSTPLFADLSLSLVPSHLSAAPFSG
jgi:hypothetical protein